MNQVIIVSLITSLALTIALEVGFFLLTGKRDKKDMLLVILVNVVTNPVVVLLYWLASLYTNWNLVLVIIPLEIFAILVEGYCYNKYGRGFKRPYIFSAAANMFSYWMGVLIQFLI